MWNFGEFGVRGETVGGIVSIIKSKGKEIGYCLKGDGTCGLIQQKGLINTNECEREVMIRACRQGVSHICEELG